MLTNTNMLTNHVDQHIATPTHTFPNKHLHYAPTSFLVHKVGPAAPAATVTGSLAGVDVVGDVEGTGDVEGAGDVEEDDVSARRQRTVLSAARDCWAAS